jgi:hypothetical protein
MTDNELPQPLHTPDFMQPFDATHEVVSMKEQLDVAENFTVLVDDLLEKSVDTVSTSAFDPNEIPRAAAKLSMPWNDLMAEITVMKQAYMANSSNDANRNIPESSIGIELIDSNANYRTEYQYRMLNGVVVRSDYEDMHLLDDAVDAPEAEMSDRDLGEMLLSKSFEGLDNEELERDMGLNDQPIGMAELNGLKDFVTSAKPNLPTS